MIARGSKPAKILEEISQAAGARGIPVEAVDRGRIDSIARGNHQGVVAFVPGFRYASFDDLTSQRPARLVLLDGLSDPVNLGSILRSADAFGWNGVLLSKHRSVSITPTVRKVAAGAAERVPVAEISSPAEAINRMKKKGFWVMGLHPDAELDYRDAALDSDAFCLVVGAEGPGLSRLVRERCDALIRIPMQGDLASINASVAAAVVMVEVTRSGG